MSSLQTHRRPTLPHTHSSGHAQEPPYDPSMHRHSFRPVGIYSLPVELLRRVFTLGAGYDFPYAESPFLLKPDQDYYAIPSSSFQLLVSHVCHHWRQIALLTSSLWNVLHFREPAHLPRAKEYLARCSASGHLLDILVDTVAESDHIPGVTLCREELHQVFDIIRPHVKRWRAFHLKIRDHECKATARQHLSSCGPAPNLETLQLYHFEDYRTSQNLYLATYRPPVMVFSNELPLLKNVSLIGVNLPWSRSPYLARLHTLELALHPETIRPPYEDWENMLRSPDLQTLSLHYSGPRVADGDTKLVWPASKERIYIESLQNLSLTDLDPDYLCRLMGRLVLPRIKQLSLDLPDQDFTPFVELIARPSPSTQSPISPNSPTPPYPHAFSHLPLPALSRLETLVLTALETSPESLRNLLRALQELRALEVNFVCISDAFPALLMEGMDVTEDEDSPSSEVALIAVRPKSGTKCPPSSCPTLSCNVRTPLRVKHVPLLPRLETFKMSGLSGDKVEGLIRYRECQDTGLARRCGETQRSFGRYGVCRWIVKWSERQRGEDKVLDRLVEDGWIGENGRRVYVETYNEDGDEEMDDDDEEGQAEDDELDDEAAGQVEEDGDDDEDEDEDDADDATV
ncbi:hypothetical protein FPV67DRAFT_749437 [Lyophyllum atratum]|nr:hypothetical protein FPV67DRAFT_749437 [Lyophyllum atratum]